MRAKRAPQLRVNKNFCLYNVLVQGFFFVRPRNAHAWGVAELAHMCFALILYILSYIATAVFGNPTKRSSTANSKPLLHMSALKFKLHSTSKANIECYVDFVKQ